jgi:hypothetical protein
MEILLWKIKEMLEETERTTTNGSKFYTKSNLCAKDGEFQCYEKKKICSLHYKNIKMSFPLPQ